VKAHTGKCHSKTGFHIIVIFNNNTVTTQEKNTSEITKLTTTALTAALSN